LGFAEWFLSSLREIYCRFFYFLIQTIPIKVWALYDDQPAWLPPSHFSFQFSSGGISEQNSFESRKQFSALANQFKSVSQCLLHHKILHPGLALRSSSKTPNSGRQW
jgi:hypothetical protein